MKAMDDSGSRRRNIFVLGYDEAHESDLHAIPDADRFRFHPLLRSDQVVYLEEYDFDATLDAARKVVRESDVAPDGIICHWDFPATSIFAILCAELGLPAPSLEAMLRCSHKYWSRLEQQRIAPESTPEFCAFDPFDDDALEAIPLEFPFWIKPIKGYGSALGFKITGERPFREAMEVVRGEIGRLGEGIDAILHRADLPAEVEGIRGDFMVAEQFVNGLELAPEGYVQHGECRVHGVIDMVRARNRKSFLRYEYPSHAPRSVQERAIDAACRLLVEMGFDHGCFNVEFFWDEESDRLWIIEINPRVSQSHSYLFEQVDGMSNHEVAVHVALGNDPEFAHGSGPCQRAAKYLYRRFDKSDAVAARVPDSDDLERLRERQPDTRAVVKLEQGQRLSSLLDEDAYSWILAELMIAGDSTQELNEKYEEATSLLPFEFEPVEEDDG